MTLRQSAPHARSRWAVVLVTVSTALGLMATAALAGTSAVSLEQCRNGAASAPNDCEALGGSSGWVNGNVGASQGHLLEGYSIPYRAILTGLPTDTEVTVTFGYDITHSGKHAIDYLTQYERLDPHTFFGHPAEAVLPTDGVAGIGSGTDTEPITNPGNLSSAASNGFNNLADAKKVITIFGGSIVDGSFAYVATGDPNASQSEARVQLTFTATSSTAVLAWGGHIARGDQWDGASASAISGSPYHMRVKAWTLGNVGNQDRSLSAGAVQAGPSSITTAPSASATFTATLNDTATVTGDSPTGNVTFTLYGAGDSACANGSIFEKTVALDGAGVASTTYTAVGTPTGSNQVTAAGTYKWTVSYAGDGGNGTSISTCMESTTVVAPSFTHVNDPV